MILLLPVISAQHIEISPNEITINLTGGNIITRNLTVRYIGKNTVPCYIHTIILPDDEGINVTYSIVSPFTAIPNTYYHVQMTINTSMLISPGTYTISTLFTLEDTPFQSGGGDGTFSTTTDDDEEKSPPEDSKPDDIEKPDDEEPMPKNGDITKKIKANPLHWLLIVSIFTILVVTLLILFKRRRKEKNETRRK